MANSPNPNDRDQDQSAPLNIVKLDPGTLTLIIGILILVPLLIAGFTGG